MEGNYEENEGGQQGGEQGTGGFSGPQSSGQPYSHNMSMGGFPAYVIRTKLSGRCLDACQTNDHGNKQGDLILYDYLGAPNQQWYIIEDSGDIIIRNVKSGMVLDALAGGNPGYGGAGQGDPRVRENMYNGSAGQKWKIEERAPNTGEYYIQNSTGTCLDVMWAKGNNNVPVVPYQFHGKDNQIWTVAPAEGQ